MRAIRVQGLALGLGFLLLGMTTAATNQITATFRVATFNVTGGYDGWPDRLPDVVATMLGAKASVHLIQEAHEEEGEHRQILREFHRQSHDRWQLVVGRGGNHFIIDSGKYRVLRKTNVHLPHDRWYTEVNLQHRATGVKFWVWNTHLIATMLPHRPGDVADRMREDQSRVIAARVERLWRSVGGGDTNDGVDGLRVNLAAVGHDEVRTLTDNVTNGEWDSHELRYEPNRMRGRWMDLLFAGDLAFVNACGLVDSGESSDHNLIWASVSIPK